jgi:starch synthase
MVVGVGFWGHLPNLVLHPQKFGMKAVPWLVADGYIAEHREVLNALPLILVTSNWVKEVYIRDGIKGDNIVVLPVGCGTDRYAPHSRDDFKVQAIREALGISDDQLMILTAGGDGASKGAQEVMQALALIDSEVPDWRYVCKVWPQPRTDQQNLIDLKLAADLGIGKKVIFSTNVVSQNFMPYLLSACDIYAAPSRLEGFGMIQVEANACEKPVIAIDAMAFRDTMVHGETAFLAKVAEERKITEALYGEGHDYEKSHRIVFPNPRTAEYRASVPDIAKYLLLLMQDSDLRRRMGEAGRRRVVELFDYRQVAKQFVRSFPTDWVFSRKQRGANARPSTQHASEESMSFDDKSRIVYRAGQRGGSQILLHNAQGPFQGLPRTAGWGYPEPYTRDLMISALGFLATGNEQLADALERTLVALADNQTVHGHIPSLAHDPDNRGSSDSTPLFLFGLALYRISTNQPEFLLEAAEKAREVDAVPEPG